MWSFIPDILKKHSNLYNNPFQKQIMFKHVDSLEIYSEKKRGDIDKQYVKKCIENSIANSITNSITNTMNSEKMKTLDKNRFLPILEKIHNNDNDNDNGNNNDYDISDENNDCKDCKCKDCDCENEASEKYFYREVDEWSDEYSDISSICSNSNTADNLNMDKIKKGNILSYEFFFNLYKNNYLGALYSTRFIAFTATASIGLFFIHRILQSREKYKDFI